MLKNKRLDLSYSQMKWETVFKRILIVMSITIVVVIVGIFITLIVQSMPSIKALGYTVIYGARYGTRLITYMALIRF